MTLNRTIAPTLHKISKPSYLRPYKFNLDNNTPIYAIEGNLKEMVRIDFIFKAGNWLQNKPLQAGITSSMLQEGTKTYTGHQLAETFDFHGAYIQLSSSAHQALISLICLEQHLEKLLPLVEEMIKEASFPEKEFSNLIDRRRQAYLVSMEKVKIICQRKFAKAFFGEKHPYGLSLKTEDYSLLNLSDCISFYEKNYNAQNCQIHLVSTQYEKNIKLLNKHFGGNDWLGEASIESACQTEAYKGGQTIRIQKDKAIQSAIRIGCTMPTPQHKDYFGLKILNTLLGGYFGSRLMSNIREDKGYTYGIGSGYVSQEAANYMVIVTEVATEYEEPTIKEIDFELNRLKTEDVKAEELHQLKQHLTGEFLRSFDGPFTQLGAFKHLNNLGLDYEHYDQYFETINTITSAQLKLLAEEYFRADNMLSVIVGA